MKNANFTVLEKSVKNRSSTLITSALIIAAALMIGNQSFADESRYRVLLEDVPGADEVEAGNILAGIKILEDQLNQVEQGNNGDIWSTLCAAYIANLSLKKAEHACTKAVDIDPTYHALNNRGVFRVYEGDLIRAREDFERVRPLDVEAYLNNIKTTNIRLVAANNFDLVCQKLAMQTAAEAKAPDVIRPAVIEDLND